MFTSKKAQYLNCKFEKISPITNIDTLYYEQVTHDSSNNTFHVERHSVAKHMPIQFNYANNIENFYRKGINYEEINRNGLITNNVSIYLNNNITKNDINNPYDNNTNTYRYNSSLYTIESNKFIDFHNILNNFNNIYEFEKIINNKNSSIISTNNLVINTSNAYDRLTESIQNLDNQSSLMDESNVVFQIQYLTTDTSIKLQVFKIENNKNFISLDESNTLSNYVTNRKWINFHYDVVDMEDGKITYVLDSNYNESDSDLTNILYECHNNTFKNINGINFLEGKYLNNEIYNSIGKFIGYCQNNIIINSEYSIGFDANSTILNNTIVNSSIISIQSGKNNTILNCNNCHIIINGDNNFIANLENVQMYLDSNNIIIGDTSSDLNIQDPTTLQSIKNNRLFLDDSFKMAYNSSLFQNCTIFGSSINKVDVYLNSINIIE